MRARTRPPPTDTADAVDDCVIIGGHRAAADPRFVARARIARVAQMVPDSERARAVRHPSVRYLVRPALDAPGYDIRADALAAVRFVLDGAAAGERVLVHCYAGVSRSATVVVLYLMLRHRIDLDQALRKLGAVRPEVRPNPGFMAWLRAMDQQIARVRLAEMPAAEARPR